MEAPNLILEDGWDLVEEAGMLHALVVRHTGSNVLDGIVQGYRTLVDEIERYNVAENLFAEDENYSKAWERGELMDCPAIQEAYEWSGRLLEWRMQIGDRAMFLQAAVMQNLPLEGLDKYSDQFGTFMQATRRFDEYLTKSAPEGGTDKLERIENERELERYLQQIKVN